MIKRDKILEDVRQLIADGQPKPDDIFTSDLIQLGMDSAAAEKYLNAKAKAGEMRKVSVVVDGRRRNAFRPV